MRRATMGSARQFAPLSIFAPVCFHIFSGPHRPRAIQNRMWWYCSFYLQAGEQESKQKQERGEQGSGQEEHRRQKKKVVMHFGSWSTVVGVGRVKGGFLICSQDG